MLNVLLSSTYRRGGHCSQADVMPLTEWGSGVPAPFNIANPSPEVMYCLSSDYNIHDDNAYPL
jgi:hypothetical protein